MNSTEEIRLDIEFDLLCYLSVNTSMRLKDDNVTVAVPVQH